MSTFSRIEYGVILDRTQDGLGYSLVHTGGNFDAVRSFATSGHIGGYPVEIKWREVVMTDWQSMGDDAAHLPECNDGCHGNVHNFLGTT